MTRATKLCADALVPALVLMACATPADASSSGSAGVSASAASVTGSPGADGSPSADGSPGADGSSGAAASAVSTVSCSGTSCSVTLAGTGSRVQVLGTAIAFEDVRDGQATVRVDEQTITCAEGQSASVGPVTLTCTDVTSNSVTMTVSSG